MSRSTEEQLLQMSLTGKLPGDLQTSFDAEKDKGNTAYRDARYHDAIRHYTEAELINPMSPIPPANRAMVYIKLRQFQKAKDEAAIAHELHQALPDEQRSEKLLVKILLRRATANNELLLFALAAEDFQAVLDLEDNDVARRELTFLKDKYRLNPIPARARSSSTQPRSNGDAKIQVVQDGDHRSFSRHTAARVTNGSMSSFRTREGRTQSVPSGIQDETALVQLSKRSMHELVAKWSAVPPQTASEFERVWNSLRSNKRSQAQYLLDTVGHERIRNGFLGESLTPQLLESFIEVLTVATEDDASNSGSVASFLFALTKVSRFDMLLMFLSPSDKKPVAALLDSLRANHVPDHQVCALRECYT